VLEACIAVKTPADYLANLIKVLRNSGVFRKAELSDRGLFFDGDVAQVHMQRHILSHGFELFLNRCQIHTPIVYEIELAYDALDIFAYIDHDIDDEPCNLQFSCSFYAAQSTKTIKRQVQYPRCNRTYMTLFVDMAVLGQMMDIQPLRLFEDGEMHQFPSSESSQIWNLIHQIFDNKWEGESRQLLLNAKALELLSMVTWAIRGQLPEDMSPEVSINDRRTLAELKSIIENRYFDNLTIGSLSKEIYKNADWIKTMYKSAYGTTVRQDIIHHRMNKALELLRVQELSVEETAHRIGYENPGYFINTFKKHFGCTPGSLTKK
jgi:AraC-like DNA-binding protein